MTDAREIIARANYEHWSNIPACIDSKPWQALAEKLPGQHADFLRKADAQIAALHTAGYRILGPDEVDPVTVEKALEAVNEIAARGYSAAYRGGAMDCDAAIRGLGGKS